MEWAGRRVRATPNVLHSGCRIKRVSVSCGRRGKWGGGQTPPGGQGGGEGVPIRALIAKGGKALWLYLVVFLFRKNDARLFTRVHALTRARTTECGRELIAVHAACRVSLAYTRPLRFFFPLFCAPRLFHPPPPH
jgi:hypothetical protein